MLIMVKSLRLPSTAERLKQVQIPVHQEVLQDVFLSFGVYSNYHLNLIIHRIPRSTKNQAAMDQIQNKSK